MADKTKSTQPSILYSDFPISFSIHPEKRDLTTITNDNAVKQSIRNLLLTDQYERLFQPTIFSGIRALLFEPVTQITSISLKTRIIETITNFEPRAQVQLVTVTPDPDRYAYSITIVFTTTSVSAPSQLSVALQAVR
jgi:phage baseplate assembly protein W